METRNLKYKAFAPTAGLDRVLKQIYLSHQYRNGLCELELKRREKSEGVLMSNFPELVELKDHAEAADKALTDYRQVLTRNNQQARSNVVTKEQSATAVALAKTRSAAWKPYNQKRKEAWGLPQVQAQLESVKEEHNQAVRDLRKQYSKEKGLYWGSYLAVAQPSSRFTAVPRPSSGVFARRDQSRCRFPAG